MTPLLVAQGRLGSWVPLLLPLPFLPPPSTGPIVAVPLVTVQASPAPTPLEKGKGVVEIESNEDSTEGLVFKRHRAMVATTSHLQLRVALPLSGSTRQALLHLMASSRSKVVVRAPLGMGTLHLHLSFLLSFFRMPSKVSKEGQRWR